MVRGKSTILVFIVFAVTFSVTGASFAAPAVAQQTASNPSPAEASPAAVPSSTAAAATSISFGDFTIGPGDILEIHVADMQDANGKYRVTDAGYLTVSMLPEPVKAAGLTSLELSKSLAQAFQKAELLRDPSISVFITEVHSRTVTVLGAVSKPSVYPLRKPDTTVIEVLSLAGGLLPTAGNAVTVVRGQSGGNSHPETINIDMAKLTQGRDPGMNIRVQPGDVVSVSTAPIVYVVGAVNKPGGYALQDPSAGITVMQAVAMASGTSKIAAMNKTVIVRRSAEAKDREEIHVDLDKLMAGKSPDIYLQANDIVFVPESGRKKSLARITDVASQAANGVAIYGLGYRIAGL